MNPGPIVLIDDDVDDLELLSNALRELQVKNEIIVFNDATKALNFFREMETKPFFVLCDINMPNLNGLELRKAIYNNPRLWVGSFPFLFLSTAEGDRNINDAYSLTIQGYFVKPTSMYEISDMLKSIISYWSRSRHPVVLEYNN
jgi:CheY-like chemotaxis protein